MVHYDINKYDHLEVFWSSKNIVTKRAPNLNAHSTHPNPWAPPSPYEGHFFFGPILDRIYRGNPTEITPIRNIYKENGFWHNLVTFTRRASLIGVFVCAWDYSFIPWTPTWQTILARGSYLVLPYTLAGASYVISQDCLESVFGDTMKAYALAAFPPAVILGIHKGTHWRTFNVFVPLALIGAAYKYNVDMGGFFLPKYPSEMERLYYDPENFKARFINVVMPDGWRGVLKHPMEGNLDKGPSWKKWLDPSKTSEGPEPT